MLATFDPIFQLPHSVMLPPQMASIEPLMQPLNIFASHFVSRGCKVINYKSNAIQLIQFGSRGLPRVSKVTLSLPPQPNVNACLVAN